MRNESRFPEMVAEELRRAIIEFRPMNSAHEGYAILKEEVDELWDQVKVKQKHRDRECLMHELVQIGAMAQRMAEDIVMARRHRE